MARVAAGAAPSPLVLRPDTRMADAGFWADNKRLHVSPFDNTIPYQLPGPLDAAWAGEGPKEFTFGVNFSPPFTIVLSFIESHESAPPALEISLDGRPLEKIQVEKGGGRPTPMWRALACEALEGNVKDNLPANVCFPTGTSMTISWHFMHRPASGWGLIEPGFIGGPTFFSVETLEKNSPTGLFHPPRAGEAPLIRWHLAQSPQ